MRAQVVGEHAVLVRCVDADDVRATYAALRIAGPDLGAVEIVPAARAVLLDGLMDPVAVLTLLADLEPTPVAAACDNDPASIPMRYDGADLDEVASQWQRTTAEVVRLHQETLFTVAFCGFAPGFAYCTGLPDGLTVRRRGEPRTAVPAGAVGLAGEYTGVYPRTAPGGWQLIGTTATRLWDADRERPALLTPGTVVRFVDA
jgi:KipI family sensor histidine kinase inhibitor